MSRLHTILLVSTFGVLAHVDDAHAICDTLNLGNGDETVVLGELAVLSPSYPTCHPLYGCVPLPDGVLAACIIEEDGTRTLEVLSCDSTTASNNQVQVNGQDGDDRVAALLLEHHPANGYFECEAASADVLIGWPADFTFGIAAHLGEDADEFYGSPRNDWVVTSYFSGSTAVADGSLDLACGLGGDDSLNGDSDDTYPIEEWLNGGTGTDFCDGDPNINGGNVADAHRNCENPVSADAKDARVSDSPVTACAADANPMFWY
jgi:hypothetical protein